MSTQNVDHFDQWIRNDFQQINTQLEKLYFAQKDRSNVRGVGDKLKQQLVSEGNQLIAQLLNEGNTDEGFDNGFDLLGNVGFFMGACRRHEISDPEGPLAPELFDASALSMQLGASLGVVPRFASAHLETHNLAVDGRYKSFTSLDDEITFLNYNTRAVFAYIRASEALLHALPLGVSHPITYDLLLAAKSALEDVLSNNQALFEVLDVDRFFYSVRPYYKTHRVGMKEYRGANAGDFAGINVIDLLLGLCRADDPYYSQLLVDKFLFMRPEDQLVLRDCMRRESLLDSFLEELEGNNQDKLWYKKNVSLFLEVCHAHGQTGIQHHEQLIKKFIEKPADADGLSSKADLTASGPPLPVMLKSLKKLSVLRAASASDQIATRYTDIKRLKDSLG